jgi:ribonuclease HI
MSDQELNPANGIAVFTDGSCSYTDKSGGWAWVALDAHGGKEASSGFCWDATTNRMELLAPIMALNTLADEIGSCELIVFSDSEYVVLGNQYPERKRKKNIDLWHDLEEAKRRHSHVEWEHVYGHTGHMLNEEADQLAGLARRLGKDGRLEPCAYP